MINFLVEDNSETKYHTQYHSRLECFAFMRDEESVCQETTMSAPM